MTLAFLFTIAKYGFLAICAAVAIYAIATKNWRMLVNTILILVAGILANTLIKSIEEPIAFNAELKKRKDVIVEKLETIRKTQEMYRDITGAFANDFDQLDSVLTNGSFALIAVTGDPDDPNDNSIRYDTTFVKALDSVRTLGIDLANLRYVPQFADTEQTEFQIAADTIEYQSTEVAVVEVGTRYAAFMGKYAKPYYAKYDQKYSPTNLIKFGDLNKPNLSGNWE